MTTVTLTTKSGAVLTHEASSVSPVEASVDLAAGGGLVARTPVEYVAPMPTLAAYRAALAAGDDPCKDWIGGRVTIAGQFMGIVRSASPTENGGVRVRAEAWPDPPQVLSPYNAGRGVVEYVPLAYGATKNVHVPLRGAEKIPVDGGWKPRTGGGTWRALALISGVPNPRLRLAAGQAVDSAGLLARLQKGVHDGTLYARCTDGTNSGNWARVLGVQLTRDQTIGSPPRRHVEFDAEVGAGIAGVDPGGVVSGDWYELYIIAPYALMDALSIVWHAGGQPVGGWPLADSVHLIAHSVVDGDKIRLDRLMMHWPIQSMSWYRGVSRGPVDPLTAAGITSMPPHGWASIAGPPISFTWYAGLDNIRLGPPPAWLRGVVDLYLLADYQVMEDEPLLFFGDGSYTQRVLTISIGPSGTTGSAWVIADDAAQHGLEGTVFRSEYETISAVRRNLLPARMITESGVVTIPGGRQIAEIEAQESIITRIASPDSVTEFLMPALGIHSHQRQFGVTVSHAAGPPNEVRVYGIGVFALGAQPEGDLLADITGVGYALPRWAGMEAGGPVTGVASVVADLWARGYGGRVADLVHVPDMLAADQNLGARLGGTEFNHVITEQVATDDLVDEICRGYGLVARVRPDGKLSIVDFLGRMGQGGVEIPVIDVGWNRGWAPVDSAARATHIRTEWGGGAIESLRAQDVWGATTETVRQWVAGADSYADAWAYHAQLRPGAIASAGAVRATHRVPGASSARDAFRAVATGHISMLRWLSSPRVAVEVVAGLSPAVMPGDRVRAHHMRWAQGGLTGTVARVVTDFDSETQTIEMWLDPPAVTIADMWVDGAHPHAPLRRDTAAPGATLYSDSTGAPP